mmetsp:Transcript_982/g.1154  ORF Transcript_982/g.1154 Transcript_982/m.1154 type:complete len:83 (+) Transcript_982:46-294(+)
MKQRCYHEIHLVVGQYIVPQGNPKKGLSLRKIDLSIMSSFVPRINLKPNLPKNILIRLYMRQSNKIRKSNKFMLPPRYFGTL